jgi:hypothetical protein
MSHCVSRIAGELALIGFAFPRPVGTVFPVKLCCEEGCVDSGVERIGFVLQRSGLIVEGGSLPRWWKGTKKTECRIRMAEAERYGDLGKVGRMLNA